MLSDEIKDRNLNTLYHLIRKGKDVSRASLGKATGLSPTSVGRSVYELIESGFVREMHPIQGNVGRQPITLAVVPEKITVISVNVMRQKVISNLVDATGQAHRCCETELTDTSVPAVVETIKRAIDGVLNAVSDDQNRNIIGIGISVPGAADYKTGRVVRSLPLGWKNVYLSEMLSCYYPYPIILDDYVKGIAKAYFYLGYFGGNYHDFLVWYLDDEVSIAAMTGGRIYRGKDNLCGDIGHISVEPNGQLCECGRRGCLNTLIGKRYLESSLGMNFSEAIRQYQEGSAKRIADIERAIDLQAEWMANLMTIFYPPTMVLTGGLIDESKALFEMIKQRYGRYMLYDYNMGTEILRSPVDAQTLKLLSPAMNIFYKMVIHDGSARIVIKD